MIDKQSTLEQVRLWVVAFSIDAGVLIAIVEFFRFKNPAFAGFAPTAPLEMIRILFYLVAFAQYFLARFARSAVLTSRPTLTLEDRAVLLKLAALVGFAVSEISVILGLVFFLLSGSRFDFYIFSLISLVCLALMIPSRVEWDEWIASSDEDN